MRIKVFQKLSVRSTSNAHDSDAIQVRWSTRMLGYIDRHLVARLASRLDRLDASPSGNVTTITAGIYGPRQVGIRFDLPV
jgi:hypothetical protein